MAFSIREADAKRLLWTSLGAAHEQPELQRASAVSRGLGCACADNVSAPPEQQTSLLPNGKLTSHSPSCVGEERNMNSSQQCTRGSLQALLRGVCVGVSSSTDIEGLPRTHPWLLTSRLVLKPDVLLKRRGKSNLVKLNLDWAGVQAELQKLLGKEIDFEGLRGPLDHFIVEPFFPHDEDNNEYYVAIRTLRTGDEVLFFHKGGVNVGNVESHARRALIPVLNLGAPPAAGAEPAASQTRPAAPRRTEVQNGAGIAEAAIGPQTVAPRGAAAEDALLWGPITFPSPFGRKFTEAEQYIRELDSKTGASLKLTVLNPLGRIWTLIAGGGASVVYADTVCDLGMGHELANYGEYSGAPSEVTTYEYTKTILGLMTAPGTYRQEGKILLIGGGIANFTNVADTFKGIIRALRDYREPLREYKVRIYVRRGGPNYQEGLKRMRDIGEELNIKMKVFGPETYITSIIPFSLSDDDGSGDEEPAAAQHRESDIEQNPQPVLGSGRDAKPETVDDFSRVHGWDLGPVSTASEKVLLGGGERGSSKNLATVHQAEGTHIVPYCGRLNTWQETTMEEVEKNPLFEKYIQNFLATRGCGSPSPPGASSECAAAAAKARDSVVETRELSAVGADSHANFASMRSAVGVTRAALQQAPQLHTIVVIAEGVPERLARQLAAEVKQKNVCLIGPATVGGIKSGAFRIGNTGGTLENVMNARLYRPGSVGVVTKSGGMLNEMNNILSIVSDGTYEAIAIGGDRFPGTTMLDHLLRFERNPDIKMLVLLGEVGGDLEYGVTEALKDGRITKPVVAWCVGVCASLFPTEVSFGHAGAWAGSFRSRAGRNNAACSSRTRTSYLPSKRCIPCS
eukprot:XP_028357237.1 ATP-citrate synthase-like [Physeter catodon]